MEDNTKLLGGVISIAREAGGAIMEIYSTDDFGVEIKKDDINSPLTKADKAANDVIVAGLQKISEHPIISEEGTGGNSEENNTRDKGESESSQLDVVRGSVFWLVDPLDGTKEFIKRNGEFTVNIALIKDNKPVLGVVYAPDKDVLYAAAEGKAFKVEAGGQQQSIASEFIGDKPVVVASRSHRDERTEALLESIGDHEIQGMGSSLKLCLVAEGKAMLYPRLAPTYLWDTAAADAVVRAAGGRTQQLNGDDLVYDPNENMKNPYFMVSTKNALDWQQHLSADD